MNLEPEFSQAEYEAYWNLSQAERDELLSREDTPEAVRALLLVQQGEQLAEQEEFELAIASYERALAINPKDYATWEKKGTSLRELDRFEEAVCAFDQSIELKPDYHWAWGEKGTALAQLKRYEEALYCCEKALEIYPERYWYWQFRGGLLYNLDRYENAAESYKKATEILPETSIAWKRWGSCLTKLNRYEEAIDKHDKAIDIEADDYESRVGRGEALLALHRYEEALASYDKALEIRPEYYCGWCKRAETLEQLRRHEEAVLSYDQALKYAPRLESSCNRKRLKIIRDNTKAWPYMANRWARGKRTFWRNLGVFCASHRFLILFWSTLALIFLLQGTLLAQLLRGSVSVLLTGVSILILIIALDEVRKNAGFAIRTYLRSGFLSYVRALIIFILTILISGLIYAYSPSFLRFGWGQLVFSNSGNWGIAQPFEIADQAANTANSLQESFRSTPENSPSLDRVEPNRFDYKWVFIPGLWVLFTLALPTFAKLEEEQYRKGIHSWKGITLSSVKFGLAHLIMGIPICIGLALSVPGFLFACRYKYTYHRHLKKFGNEKKAQEAGVLASTADHAIYNVLAVTLVAVYFLLQS